MNDLAYPEARLMAGITARKASNPDERARVLLVERQSTPDMLLEINSETVILSVEEARALCELLSDMAERVQTKLESLP